MKYTVYCHTHVETGRRYIGLTKLRWERRWSQHLAKARSYGLGRNHWYNALVKYGKDAFSHEVLEVCTNLEVANLAEECWIELYETRDPEKGFNLMIGGRHTPHPLKNPWDRPDYREKSLTVHAEKRQRSDYRRALSASTSKLWKDPEYRAVMSASSTEVNSRPEVREAIAAANRGKTMSPETRAKISAARKGKSLSPETRAKISAAAKLRAERL